MWCDDFWHFLAKFWPERSHYVMDASCRALASQQNFNCRKIAAFSNRKFCCRNSRKFRGPAGCWTSRFGGAPIFSPEVPKYLFKRALGPLDGNLGCPKNTESNHEGSNPHSRPSEKSQRNCRENRRQNRSDSLFSVHGWMLHWFPLHSQTVSCFPQSRRLVLFIRTFTRQSRANASLLHSIHANIFIQSCG